MRKLTFLLLLGSLLGSQCFSTIAFDAVSSAAIGTVDISYTHTPVGTPAGVFVYVVQAGTSTDQVASVTYGGDAMTEVSVSPVTQAGGEISVVYTYFLGTSIPTGAQTVFVDVTNSTNKSSSCVTVTAAADCEIVDVDGSINSDAAADPSATLSLGGRSCFAILGFHSGQNAPTGTTPFANWNSRFEDDFGTRTCGTYTYDIVSTTDVTMGWTQTSEDAQCIGVAIAEVAGAPAGKRRIVIVGD